MSPGIGKMECFMSVLIVVKAFYTSLGFARIGELMNGIHSIPLPLFLVLDRNK